MDHDPRLGRDPQIGCSFWNSLAESDLLDMLLRGNILRKSVFFKAEFCGIS